MVAGDPIREKLLVAEDRVALVRTAVIFFNVLVYLLFLDPAVGIRWLAWVIIVAASVYALVVILARPHRRAPVLMSGWLTTATDSTLIVGWIVATGGFHSPFYLLWYVSLAAIAFRFGMRETFVAAGIYIVTYGGLLGVMGQLSGNMVEVAIRCAYIVFVAVLVALLAHESVRQWHSRSQLRRVAAGGGPSSSAAVMTREVDMDRTLRTVLESTRAFVRADRAAVWLLDDDTETLRCAYAEGLSDQWIQARTQSYKQLPGLAVLEGSDYLHIADARTDPRLEPVRDAVLREKIRTYCVFPLQLGNDRIGLLSLYRDRVEPFSPLEIELAASLADRAAGTIANTRLIKELSDSEARLQKVLSNAPVVLFATDREGRFTIFEGEGTNVLRVDPSASIGRHVNEVYGDHPTIPLYVSRALEGKEFVDEVELDGVTCSVHYAPLRDENGQLDGMIGVAVDVTERKHAEREEAQREKEQAELHQLREIDQFKTLFINTAAHELRTPLTPIKVQLHLLRAGGLDGLNPRQCNALDVLDRNIDRLAHLVEDILEGARLQAGRLKVVKRTVALDRVVREAVESFTDPARENGIVLESKLEPDLVVPADAKRIIQVLFNLLSNALKFTPRGGRILVQTHREGDAACVRVSDTGSGLSKNQVARLFRPFSQVHDPLATVKGGTGLGLYISRSLVELHGGRIWCESPGPGEGTTFSFTVPLTAQSPAQETPDWTEVAHAKSRKERREQKAVEEGSGTGDGEGVPGRERGQATEKTQEKEKEKAILSPAEKDRLARRARELV